PIAHRMTRGPRFEAAACGGIERHDADPGDRRQHQNQTPVDAPDLLPEADRPQAHDDPTAMTATAETSIRSGPLGARLSRAALLRNATSHERLWRAALPAERPLKSRR